MGRRKFGYDPLQYFFDLDRLIFELEEILNIHAAVCTLLPTVLAVVEELRNPDEVVRTGGYFCLAFRSDIDREVGRFTLSKPALRIPVGIVPLDKADKWCRLSLEKARRLAKNLPKGHVSSWQSRDGKVRFGGSIATRRFIFSFSGLPELADEAFMLCLAVYLQRLTERKASEIAALNNNRCFPPLMKRLKQAS